MDLVCTDVGLEDRILVMTGFWVGTSELSEVIGMDCNNSDLV